MATRVFVGILAPESRIGNSYVSFVAILGHCISQGVFECLHSIFRTGYPIKFILP